LLSHQRRRIWQSPLEAPNFSAKWRKKDAVIAAIEGPSSSFSSSSYHHLSLSLSQILQPKLPRPKRRIYLTEISLSVTAPAPSHENCKSKFADRQTQDGSCCGRKALVVCFVSGMWKP
jgi:hypothetical protein